MPSSPFAPSITRLRRSGATLGAAGYFALLLFRHAPLASVLLLLANALQGAATPLTVWAMAGLLNAAGPLAAHSASPWRGAAPWLAALLVATLLRGLGTADPFLSTVVRERVDTAVHQRLFAKAAALPLATFEHPDYYTKLETGRQALGGSLVVWVGEVSWLISHAVGVAGLLLVYARVNLPLAAVLCLTTVVQGILGARLSRAFSLRNLQNSPLRREMRYWADLLTDREAAPELRLFGLGPHLLARWRALFLDLLTDLLALRRKLGRQTFRQAAVGEGVALVALLYLLLLGLHGTIGLGALVGLLYGLGRFRDLVGNVSGTAQRLGRLWHQLGCLREFLTLPEEPQRAPARRPSRPLHRGVEFRDVSFTYPGAARPALSGVNLLLRPGEHVALVGENGAGKTTLARLLLGLYRPTTGRIQVDGVDLDELDLATWRREATGIFQDFVRYPTSVLENIAYADVSLLADGDFLRRPVPDRVAAAARRSAAAPFVERLPQGYATLLGKEFDGAVDLSAGQWQRLALARAYLRDAQLVVLDEPTAALDPRAEAEVYREFGRAAAGRTAVFISHRLGSARLADRVVVLHGGRVVEEGSHAALLRAAGAYARMYGLQASWYAAPPGAEDAASARGDRVAAAPSDGEAPPAAAPAPALEGRAGGPGRERPDDQERRDGGGRPAPYARRWRCIPRLLRLCWETGPWLFLARLAFQGAQGLYPLVGVFLLRGLITAAQRAVEGRVALAPALAWGLALAGFTLVQVRLNTAGNVVSLRFEQRLRLAIEERCYALVQAMPLEELERPERHDTLARARRGVEQRLSNTLAFVGMATRDLVTALSLLLYLVQFHWTLPLLLAAGTTPAVALRVRQLGQEFLLQRALTPEERRFGVYDALLTGRAAAAELRLFGFGPWMAGHAGRLRRRMAAERQRLAIAGSVRTLGAGVCNAVAYAAALALGVALLIAGRIGLGAAATLFSAIEGFQQAYLDTLWEAAVISNDLRYLQDVFDFLDGPTLDLRAGRDLAGPIRTGVVFEHVGFTYPGSPEPALHDLCLTIRPGERIALVGENGAGKTTLVKLVLGLYRPTAGRILVDGVDLAELAPACWHRRGGAVFQHFLRYQTTIRENIGFGWVDGMGDAACLAEAARRSGAAEVAANFPQGLDTPLGKEFHDGTDLSLGQWQKLAIARAYMRPAELLILDEPASALDAKAEAGVYDHFAQMAQATTAVLVSHRLGSCKLADRILVLRDGRLAEEGTHQALLAAGGTYAELYRLQAAWYQ